MAPFLPQGLSRRALLAAAAAAPLAPLAFSARAATPSLAPAVEQAGRLDQLRTLLVAQNGETVLAEGFRGGGVDRIANVKSVSKTIVATLVGIAIDRGLLRGVDQRVTPVLGVPAGADPRVEALTVGDLLTMRAGLERTSGPGYGAWVQSRNWVDYALSRPFVADPGDRMLYSTGDYHLLAALLTEASGRSLLALARDWLGAPLGIEIPPWTRDPQGIYMGGNNMGLTPRGLLRFGELWRRGGTWDGRQVVGQAWIEASWQPRTHSPFSGHDYGYGWFIANAADRRVYYARGYGGQMIYVLPDVAATVVITSDPTQPARSGGYIDELHGLLTDAILPALAET